MIHSEDDKFFSSKISLKDALVGVGILGKQPGLSFNVCNTDEEKLIIAKWLVQINRTIPLKDVGEFLNCKTNLVPHELKLKGKVGWDSSIPVLTNNDSVRTDWETIKPDDELRLPQVRVTYYKCPNCSTVETSSCSHFQTVDLDKKHKCFYCSSNSEVKLWKCDCDTVWHICTKHRYNNNATPEKTNSYQNRPTAEKPCKRYKSASSKLRKRKLYPPQQYDDALADDVERAEKKIRKTALNLKRKSVVALGELTHRRIRPTLLGPALTVRLTQIAETPLRVFNSECAGQ